MKKSVKMLVLIGMTICLTGCLDTQNTAEGQSTEALLTETQSVEIQSAESQLTDIQSMKEQAGEELTTQTDSIDCDLTVMGSDMVYATVYQMMIDPGSYIGKTVKMEGAYYPLFDETTKKTYHYVIIRDAMACCSQGIEFVWEDGSHIYPDEYPEEDAEVIVTGVFETYCDEGDTTVYCRLHDASLQVVDKSEEIN